VLQGADRFQLDEVLLIALASSRAFCRDESVKRENPKLHRAERLQGRCKDRRVIIANARDSIHQIQLSQVCL
jgi:hypothetical protein